MSNITVSEKYTLCMLKEIKNFSNMELSIHLVTAMLIEMMLEGNIEIIKNFKKSFIGCNMSVKLNAKVPKEEYNQIFYNYLREASKDEINMYEAITSVCYGRAGFSDKKYKEIVTKFKEKMISDNLIFLSSKKGLFGKREIININDEKFDIIVNEIRDKFIDKGNYNDEMILLASLLNSTNFLKNIVYKYEKEDLKNRLNEIKDTDISKSVKVAREVIAIITSTML